MRTVEGFKFFALQVDENGAMTSTAEFDAMVAAALVDRLVHHATMVALKGKSYRLRERGTDVAPARVKPSRQAP